MFRESDLDFKGYFVNVIFPSVRDQQVCVCMVICAGDGFIDELLDGRDFGQFV